MLDKQPTSMPDGEADRLRTLAAYGLASTPPEADFNQFASMAADLFGT